MKIDLYDRITLNDNNNYIVGYIIVLKNIKYYLLCNEKNPNNYMFCYLKNNKLIKVEEKNLLQILNLKITKELL